MSFDKKLYDKPVYWGSAYSTYATFTPDSKLQIVKTKANHSDLFNNLLAFISNDSNRNQVKAELREKSVKELKVFYRNISNLANKKTYYFLFNNPFKALTTLVDEELTNRHEQAFKNKIFLPPIPLKIKERLSTMLDAVHRNRLQQIYQKYAYVRSFYEDDYIVALHSQSTTLMVINDLFKEVYKLQNPNKPIKNFKFLRAPSHEKKQTNIEFVKERINKPDWIDSKTLFDHFFGDELISVDLYDENIDEAESSFYFLNFNTNICTTTTSDLDFNDPLERKFKTSMQKYLDSTSLSGEQKKLIINKMIEIGKEISPNPLKGESFPGNLYVICIPKADAAKEENTHLYLSREGGLPFRYEASETYSSLMKALQERDLQKLKRFKQEGVYSVTTCFPQGRILAKALNPESNVLIFRLNSLSADVKKQYKGKIRSLAKEIHEGSSTL